MIRDRFSKNGWFSSGNELVLTDLQCVISY